MNIANHTNPKLNNKICLVEVTAEGVYNEYSYKQLDEASSSIARGLRSRGIVLQDRVAIVSDNTFNYVATYYGILKAGAIAVLINTRLTSDQINYIIADSETKIILTDRQLNTQVQTVKINDPIEFGEFCDDGEFDVVQNPGNAVYLYTSGSTGTPKGVIYSHENHLWIIDKHSKISLKSETTIRGRIAILTPFYHLNGLSGFEVQIMSGNLVVIFQKFSPNIVLRAIQDYKITVIPTITTIMAILSNYDDIDKYNTESVRIIRIGSSITTAPTIDKIQSNFKYARIIVTYGSTELGPGIFGLHPNKKPLPKTSVGYPSAGILYRIVDGVLHVKSPALMVGYNKAPPPLTNDGYYVTGDLFEVDSDGFYYCLGRADDMFKSGGNIVHPFEIETILESHPAVKLSAVFPIEDDIKQFIPVAYVVANYGVSEADLKEYIITKTAAYKHPRKIVFLDEMPTVGVGKINKNQLKLHYKEHYDI